MSISTDIDISLKFSTCISVNIDIFVLAYLIVFDKTSIVIMESSINLVFSNWKKGYLLHV